MDELRGQWVEDHRWLPQINEDRREHEYANWKRAVADPRLVVPGERTLLGRGRGSGTPVIDRLG